ncbi:MAG: S1 family peptidase [Deltaproteobacteria bacterium]|nr:S1 family peptidase [Deltaproteobacteria bacterium]
MKRLLLFGIFGLLVCCKSVERSNTSPKTPEAGRRAADKKPAKKCLKIVDGVPALDAPAVYLLVLIDPASRNVRLSCSGTFVSDNTLITAGHCVPAAGEKYVLLATNGLELSKDGKAPAGAITPLKAFFDPSLSLDGRGGRDLAPNQSPEIDLAVLIFPDNTAKYWLPLATTSVPAGTEVKLVGYGSSHAIYPDKDNSTSVKKMMGYNKIAPLGPIEGNLPTKGLLFTFAWGEPGEAAKHGEKTVSGAPGDSGGPLIANGVIVGTVSRGITSKEVPSLEQQIGTNTLGIFVDVTNAVAKNLLAKAKAAGARINYADPATHSETKPEGYPEHETEVDPKQSGECS